MTKARSSQSSSSSHEQILGDVVQLIQLMGETGLAELELETPALKMSLKKNGQPVPVAAPVGAPVVTSEPIVLPSRIPIDPLPVSSTASSTESTESTEAEKTSKKIVSPMAGTFYRAPSPTASPYVQEGDKVVQGQTVCIVEAMKLMNEIKTDVSGKVVKILVENGQPVEKNTVLFWIQPAA